MSRCAGGGAWPARELQLEPGVAGPGSGGGIGGTQRPFLSSVTPRRKAGEERGVRGAGAAAASPGSSRVLSRTGAPQVEPWRASGAAAGAAVAAGAAWARGAGAATSTGA
eukprot:CAMPEP_0118839040 /NCGR_PEP_ID=MMETSP1162-20130426/68204_1 /TAXON_ID=33656 /ORGANISM="Phaeocystis Sp, Strain CCMP2710" /LENGTH=109 /DNA_ID=CAMNT_0006770999 /DNA_START=90 /DNA_END=417 /DNA_ORIENTATION=+